MISRPSGLGDDPRAAIRLLETDVVTAARGLVGWTLIATTPAGLAGGVIVESEAYRARDDPACHAYRRRTARNDPIYGPAGTLYVYLSYGLHTMLNLATGRDGEGEAVLIRALEPTIGLDLMAARRDTGDPQLLCKGPARLAQALGIELEWSGGHLGQPFTGNNTSRLDLVAPPDCPDYALPAPSGVVPACVPRTVVATTRIGITRGRELPWRFLDPASPYVSRGVPRANLS